MPKGSKSYFYRLFLSFLVCSAVVLGLFSLMAYLTFERAYTKRLRAQCVSTAQQVAAAIDETAFGFGETINELSKNEDVLDFLRGRADEDDALAILRRMYTLKNASEYQSTLTILSTRTGSSLTTGAENTKLEQQYIRNWGAFRSANASNDVVVHTVSHDAVLDRNTRICTILAVRDSDRSLLGYLFVEIPRSTLVAIAAKYAAQYNTALMLVNGSHSVIYHSRSITHEGLGKLNAVDGLEQAWSSSSGGSIQNDTFVYSQAPGTALMVLQEIPNDIVPQLRKALASTALAAIAFSLLICLVMAYVIAQSVSRPIQRLKRSMDDVRHGDLHAKVQVSGHDEISQLGEAFNDMTDRIEVLVRHVEEKQKSLRVAEARALSLQVNPHFIYNTLELIRWSAKLNKTDVAVSITVNFGKLLRRILNNKDDVVTLQYEMEMVNAYVEIQKQRYGDRLSVICDIPDALMNEPIPKLLLQPLVENAIVHGLEDKPGVGKIELSVAAAEDYLRFTVSDNGLGMSAETLTRVRDLKENGMYSIGLHNVHQRAVVYGDEHCGLQISSTLGEGTSILLTVKRQQHIGEVFDV